MKDSLPPVLKERLTVLLANKSGRQTTINAAQQLLQELILFALARAGFFVQAAFHGGTALRILYGARRFSEDLDFALLEPESGFDFERYLPLITQECSAFGIQTNSSLKHPTGAVHSLWLQDQTLAEAAELQPGQKLRVKLKVDTNPPVGAGTEHKLLAFPVDHYVTVHDRASLFAGKLHAVLCRAYDKGRDWFDLLEYLKAPVAPNLALLKAALLQVGPYQQELPDNLSWEWIQAVLLGRIDQLQLLKLKNDVARFLFDPRDIEVWSKKYFQTRVLSFNPNPG